MYLGEHSPGDRVEVRVAEDWWEDATVLSFQKPLYTVKFDHPVETFKRVETVQKRFLGKDLVTVSQKKVTVEIMEISWHLVRKTKP